jgi:selenocysteine lyase/cysteine desulfurase
MTHSLSDRLEDLRAETRGCAEWVHLNNAGASLMPDPVVEAVQGHLDLEVSTGGYEAEALRQGAIEAAYGSVARLLGCAPQNVAMMEHATAAFVAALSSVPFEPGDRILTTRHDYVSNQIQYLSLARRFGVEVVRAPDAADGGVDAGAMADLARRLRPRLVAMTHIPTNSGLVQDVAILGQECRELGLTFLVDGCQSVGQMPIDVEALGCDFFSATSRKFLRGPRGAGFLYVSDRLLDSGVEPLFPDLRGAEWIEADLYQPDPTARRFESWEFFHGLVLGTGAAADYALGLGLDAIRERAWDLAASLRVRLDRIPGVRVLDRGSTLCAIVTCWVEGREPEEMVELLRGRGINASAVDLASGVIDFAEKGVTGALRISPHYYNTEEELETLAGTLEEMLPWTTRQPGVSGGGEGSPDLPSHPSDRSAE